MKKTRISALLLVALLLATMLPVQADGAAREEVTLTAFIQQSVTSESGIWLGWGAKRLYEDTGIKLDFYPTGNEVEQKLQQYLAADDLPDIIGFKGLDQAQLAMNAEMLLPLDDYADKLPNLFANDLYTNAIAYSKDFTSNDTGKLLIMPTAIGPTGYNSYNWQPMLQWDAWKKAGKQIPATLEEYLDVVEAMVKVKPTTPSGEKVYGFSLFSDWDKYTALQISTLSFFYGIDTEYISHLMETNVITKEIGSVLDEDSFYKRALKFYFEANQRGLLDPDSMTQTFSNVDAKYSAGRVMFSHFSWMTGSYNSRSAGHVDNPEMPDGYEAIVADDMKLYVAPEQTIGRNWYFAINKNAKNLDRVLEFLNWFYDPAIIAYLSNGPEGIIWTRDENGEPYVIDESYKMVDNNAEPLMPEEVGGGAFRDGMFAFNTPGLQASVLTEDGYTLGYRYWPTHIARNPTLMRLEWREIFDAVVLADYVNRNNNYADSTQAVNMITPASDEMEITLAQIGEVVKMYSWQMVYAEDEAAFENLWQKMKTDAEGLGMADVVEYYTSEWQKAIEKATNYE
ncbi:MAG: extracellular solute-binding protein [Christensenellales bacterium]|jgi:putative aldouronate transport system substrate-binding protein